MDRIASTTALVLGVLLAASAQAETLSHRPVDLRAIAPAGFGAVALTVYVSRNDAQGG